MRILTPGHGLDPGGELALGVEGQLARGSPRLFRVIVTKTALHSTPLASVAPPELRRALERTVAVIAPMSPAEIQVLGFELVANSVWQRVLVAAELTEAGDLETAVFRPRAAAATTDVLRVFLSYASEDRNHAEPVYQELQKIGAKVWMDKHDLLPGQNWEQEIQQAVRGAHVVVALLSRHSVSKEGFVQKELRFALDVAKEKPEGTIFLVPARLDDCPLPHSLRSIHCVDLPAGFEGLRRALGHRAHQLGLALPNTPQPGRPTPSPVPALPPRSPQQGPGDEAPYIVETDPTDRIQRIAARAKVHGTEFLVVASQFNMTPTTHLRGVLLETAQLHFDDASVAGRDAVASDEWWQARGFVTGRYGAKWELRI